MANTSDEVADFLASYLPAVCEIAIELRQIIRSVLPKSQEMLDRPARIVGYGFGSGYSDLICTIIPSKNGVKLGIARGADLPDPDKLLEGAGKRHRYVALTQKPGTRGPAIRRLLKAAHAAWEKR